ncbi:hypothetical protein ACFXAQ_36715 [Streptomyces olivaceus]|uniref:hypothetical protein n=1 Tax=Streptomyces olivaceus TaxID=47716 RepID=UPI00369FE892
MAAAAARVQAERAALVSAAGSGTVPAVAGSGTVPAPAAQARSRKRAADEERERRDEQSARLSGKVLVPASAADAPAAEETFDALVSAPGPGPAEGDYPPPSFGPFYGGPFVPPPAFGRRGVRIRS